MQLKLTHAYQYPAEQVWALAVDFEALKEVMQGLVHFEGLPDGRLHEGQHIEVMVSLFGRLPAQPYTMDVVECDEAQMRFVSSEVGAGVKVWQHNLQVVAVEGGCEIREQVTIKAGLMTPLFWAWARFLYKRRHPARLRLLANAAVSH